MVENQEQVEEKQNEDLRSNLYWTDEVKIKIEGVSTLGTYQSC